MKYFGKLWESRFRLIPKFRILTWLKRLLFPFRNVLNANSLFSKYKKNYFCPILKKAILMLFDAFDAFGSFGSAWKWFEQWKISQCCCQIRCYIMPCRWFGCPLLKAYHIRKGGHDVVCETCAPKSSNTYRHLNNLVHVVLWSMTC